MATDLKNDINKKLKYLTETKELIKQAIIKKGQKITNEPFREYASKINNITTPCPTDVSNYINLKPNANATITSLIYKLPNIDISKFTSLDFFISGLSSIKEIPMMDTSKITSMIKAFEKTGITTIPLLNTSKVASFKGAFLNDINLTTIPLLNTSSCTDMSEMFLACPKLANIPKLDTSKVTNMEFMFGGSALEGSDIKFDSALSDNSLNNILEMCINSKCATKTLSYIGLSAEQKEKCKKLSNWENFTKAGWTE